MFQGDPHLAGLGKDSPSERDGKANLNSDTNLGMEARSILRSIQTEHQKLSQNPSLTRSDLHYFRARYNYYRLSLLRLEDSERQTLQLTLNSFRAQIAQVEATGSALKSEEAPPPFLEAVSVPSVARSERAEEVLLKSSHPVLSKPEAAQAPKEAPEPAVQVNNPPKPLSSPLTETLISELQLLEIALSAEASNDRNQVCVQSISRMISRLKSTADS